MSKSDLEQTLFWRGDGMAPELISPGKPATSTPRWRSRPKHLEWMLRQAKAIFHDLVRSQRGLGTKSVQRFFVIFAGCFLLALVSTSRGAILDFKQINIDFTDLASATTNATWSKPDQLSVSKDGLGWDGRSAELRDGWIRTKPLALGLSWRTPYAVSVRVAIQPPAPEITLDNGQKSAVYAGDAFVRYSPDRKHWSSWQAMQPGDPQNSEDKKIPGRYFSANVRVPQTEREPYGKLLSEYSTLDVPWKSDEEAAVRWILSREPDFFAKQIPFIGYLEIMFENSFHGGQRIRSLRADISYGMSGLHSAPRDEAVRKEREQIPWRFEAPNEKGNP